MCQQTYIYHRDFNVAINLLKTFLSFNPLDGGHYDGTGFIIVESGLGWKHNSPGYIFSKFIDTDPEIKKSVAGKNSFIAHVRRATVGEVSTNNSHPYNFRNLIGVHNGTFRFFSGRVVEKDRTDSYNFYKLLNKELNNNNDVVSAINNVLNEHISSASKFSFIFLKKPENVVYVVKYDRPLHVVIDDEFFIINTRIRSIKAVLAFNGIEYGDVYALDRGIYRVVGNDIEKVGDVKIKAHIYNYTYQNYGAGGSIYWNTKSNIENIYVTPPTTGALIFWNLLLKSVFNVMVDKGAIVIYPSQIKRFISGKKKNIKAGKTTFKLLFGDLMDLNEEIASGYSYYSRDPVNIYEIIFGNNYHYSSWRPIKIYDNKINFGDFTEYTLERLNDIMKKKAADLVSVVVSIAIRYILDNKTIVLKSEILNKTQIEIFDDIIRDFISRLVNKTNRYSIYGKTKKKLIDSIESFGRSLEYKDRINKLTGDELALAFAFIYSIFWRGI